jgi:hypothetical protein
MSSADIEAKAILEAHKAICEDSVNECLEYYGKCIRAVEAIATHLTITKKEG